MRCFLFIFTVALLELIELGTWAEGLAPTFGVQSQLERSFWLRILLVGSRWLLVLAYCLIDAAYSSSVPFQVALTSNIAEEIMEVFILF